jgi:hypothetical protein
VTRDPYSVAVCFFARFPYALWQQSIQALIAKTPVGTWACEFG